MHIAYVSQLGSSGGEIGTVSSSCTSSAGPTHLVILLGSLVVPSLIQHGNEYTKLKDNAQLRTTYHFRELKIPPSVPSHNHQLAKTRA